MAFKKNSRVEVDSNVNYKPSKGYHNTAGDKFADYIRRFFDSSQIFVIAMGILVLIYLFVASFSIVDGPSMLPNFETGDLTIYEKISSSTNNLQRGDVIVFEAPTGKDFIKRIIALPGDSFKIESGHVYVNNVAINEDYLSPENRIVQGGNVIQEGKQINLPQDQYVALGDNRKVSLDSRSIGTIDRSKIKGKVLLVFWPLNKFHFVNHIRYSELGDK